MSGKFALIIGNTEYIDPRLAQLTAPSKDAEEFARVLKDQEICAFDDVKLLLNQPEHIVRGTIDEFFAQKRPDDLLVLYFSGHSIQDELGTLYLAVNNTNRFRLRSTAIKSNFVYEAMDQSRSKRQVLILDCCNIAAFAHGIKAATGVSIGAATAFEAGYGHVILTASDSIQFVWEGDKVTGETNESLFTHFLVEGLEGEADLDGDGCITVDELYNYTFKKVKFATPKQTPLKFTSKEQGAIVLRQIRQIEDIKTFSLSDDLISEIEDLRPYVREAAVQRLETIIKGKDINLARSAKEALERIAADENTTHRVAQIATQVLESIRQAEQKGAEELKGKDELERHVILLAEDERSAGKKAKDERKAKEEAQRLLTEQKADEESRAREKAERITMQRAEDECLVGEKVEVEQLADIKIQAERLTQEIDMPSRIPRWISVLWITLGWTTGWIFANIPSHAIRWVIAAVTGHSSVTAIEWRIAAAINGASAAAIGGLVIAIDLRIERVLSSRKSMLWITLGWAFGGALGMAIGWTSVVAIGMATGWANATTIGLAIGWAIAAVFGGLVTTVTLRSEHVLSDWKSMFWITLGWVLGGILVRTIAWVIATKTDSLITLVLAATTTATIAGFITAITLRIERVLSSRKSMLWITLGWVFGWISAVALAWVLTFETNLAIAVVSAALIDGLITAITFRINHVISDWKSMIWITLGLAIGWTLSITLAWLIVFTLLSTFDWRNDLSTTIAIMAAITVTIAAIVGLITAITFRINHILSYWKSMFWITLSWEIGWALSVVLAWALTAEIDWARAIEIGWVIGWAISGLVMILLIRKNLRVTKPNANLLS